MPQYVIVSAGRSDCAGTHVIDDKGEIAVFATRREARARRDELVPDMPSKYLPLRVRERTA
jgi:hypothetical protein